jgi:hypothetical protein
MASLVNKTNAHTGGFLSSNEGPVSGCTGKGFGVNGCGIKMYHGLVGQSGGKKRRRSSKKKRRRKKKRKTRKRKTKNKRRKRRHRGGATTNLLDPRAGLKAFATRGGNGSRGLSVAEKRTLRGGNATHFVRKPHNHHTLVGGGVGYGMTAKNASNQANSGTPSGTGEGFHSTATTSVTGYKNCGLIPNFKLGAGRNFKGPADIQSGAGKSVSAYNQYNSAGYGYLKPTSKGNADIAGYHAPITSTSKSQRCGTGGKKKKRGGTRKRKAGSSLNPLTLAYDGLASVIDKGVNTVHNASMLSDKAGGSSCSKRKRKKKNKKKKKKSKGKKRGRRGGRKTQKGGYAQYGSNTPLTRTLELPAGAQGGSWEGQLASPPTYTAGDFCQDNYNHFTGKGSPSPVLDQAAPVGKTMSFL